MPKVLMTTLLSLSLANAAALTTIDPTKPYEYEGLREIQSFRQGEETPWSLRGIKIKASGKSAILNGRLVREGDTLDGARVVEIRPAEVILLRDQQRLTVKLLIREIKSSASGASDRQ